MSGMGVLTFKLIFDNSVSQSFHFTVVLLNLISFEEITKIIKTLKKPHINVTPEN